MDLIVNLCAFDVSHRADSINEVTDDHSHLVTRLRSICQGLKQLEVVAKSALIASLYFDMIDNAKEAVIGIWDLRLQGVHHLTPVLASSAGFQDESETEFSIDQGIGFMFLVHISRLRDSDLVNKCINEEIGMVREIQHLTRKSKVFQPLQDWQRLQNKKQSLSVQHQSLRDRLREFYRALDCIECCVEKRVSKSVEAANCDVQSDDSELFALGKKCTWQQVHCLLDREERRFQTALPLYAKRSNILSCIQENQVVILIGETGSGKSTQLVQYLADAGLSRRGKCIACTQPRRVAAMAVTQQVAVECAGCYPKTFSVSCLTNKVYKRQQASEITLMTDYALLQSFLDDKNLDQFSCVIIDEAHERSLNTDILLGLLKSCLPRRPDLRVVIMSASPDTRLLSTYFHKCKIIQISGRAFQVDIQYEPADSVGLSDSLDLNESDYAVRVLQKVSTLHDSAEEGNILAFLTSQAEVEWACSHSFPGLAIVLPFHGKMQYEDQLQVFKEKPSTVRMIVFATNLAETSLTIPGVRYVVDSGMAKDSFFDPKTGMKVLEVGFIDQSAALQRAGRAGRTQPGICYRLYSKLQYEKMKRHRTPEILRVHLGIALLKLLALGIEEPECFNFIEPPSPEAICLAIKTLHHLGAIEKGTPWKLTTLGLQLQKLGIEPRIGKVLLECIAKGYPKEGLALAALMSFFGSVFFRSGTEEQKARADRLRMRFCHPASDLLTLLSVYREWESIPTRNKKAWCFANSVHHKTLQRCHELIRELETCVLNELQIEVPQSWVWSHRSPNDISMVLQKIIFSILAENLAVFSGHEGLGYDVILSKQKAHLHPSSAVVVFGNMPKWLVFVQLVRTSRNFLHCITVIDPKWLYEESVLQYDVEFLESHIFHRLTFSKLGAQLLRNICGKQNQKLLQLKNSMWQEDHRCIIEPDYEKNELRVFVTSSKLTSAKDVVGEVVQRERRWLYNQCSEHRLFYKSSELDSPAILFSAGAMIRDILMPGEFASVEVCHPEPSTLDETEILVLFDKCGEGIGNMQRYHQTSRKEGILKRWGVITLRSYLSAKLAVECISEKQMGNHSLTVVPIKSQTTMNSHKSSPHALKATIACLRRQAFGIAKIKCEANEISTVVQSCHEKNICGSIVICYPDRTRPDSVCIKGLKCNVFLSDVEKDLRGILERPDLQVWIPRRPAPLHPSLEEFQTALMNQISSYVPVSKFEVEVSPLVSDRDYIFKAFVKFDESQFEAAEVALKSLTSTVLPNFQQWQSLRCLPLFSTSLHCNCHIFRVLKEELDSVIQGLAQQHNGVRFSKELTANGGQRIHISATSISMAAHCRAALERVMEATVVTEDTRKQGVMNILFTREGLSLVKQIEVQTSSYISVDKRTNSLKVYGTKSQKECAIEKISCTAEQLHEKHKSKEILLRGEELPQGLMKEIVQQFGANLARLQQIAGAPVKMDHRRQSLYVNGEAEAVHKVQSAITAIATELKGSDIKVMAQGYGTDANCNICFSPFEDRYSLEGCGHSFCRSCLLEQINSLIHHREGFPLACVYRGCGHQFLLADIEALLSRDLQEELQRVALSVFVAASRGSFKFCFTPDCPMVYRASSSGGRFTCPACSVKLCTSCHVEYHEGLSCELYRTYRQDPDASLQAWRDGKVDVKDCPSCHSVIEKIEGCNHITCKCGMHVCWICLIYFQESSACYSHLKDVHGGYA